MAGRIHTSPLAIDLTVALAIYDRLKARYSLLRASSIRAARQAHSLPTWLRRGRLDVLAVVVMEECLDALHEGGRPGGLGADPEHLHADDPSARAAVRVV